MSRNPGKNKFMFFPGFFLLQAGAGAAEAVI